MTPRAIFCDFDGTISGGETFVRVLKTYAPDLAQNLIPKIQSFEITLVEGVTRMLHSIPSSNWESIVSCCDDVPLRPGFAELVHWSNTNDIPFVVVSGGLQAMIERKLGPLKDEVTAIHAVSIDASEKYLRVISPFSDDVELVAKVRVMERYPATERVAIGDSTTDVRMAQVAEHVFARDRLVTYLTERNVGFNAWGDFHDVRKSLAQTWGLDA